MRRLLTNWMPWPWLGFESGPSQPQRTRHCLPGFCAADERRGTFSGWSAHERLAFDLDCFLIALLGAQRIGQQPPRLSLRAAIAAGERKRLAAAALSLMGVALREPQPPQFYPYQGIVRLDAQGTVERRRGAVKVTARHQRSCLADQRTRCRRQVIFARRRRRRRRHAWRCRTRARTALRPRYGIARRLGSHRRRSTAAEQQRNGARRGKPCQCTIFLSHVLILSPSVPFGEATACNAPQFVIHQGNQCVPS